MIDKSLRSRYQWGGPGGKSPGTSPGHGQGNQGGGGRDFMPATTFTAPAKPAYVAPVTQRDVMPVIAPKPWEPISPTKEYVAPIVHPEFDPLEKIEEQKEIIKEQVLKQKIADPTDELTTLGKEEIESFERKQDWDTVNELVDKGADFEDLNTLMDQGLLEKSNTQPFVRDFGQNNLVKSLMAEVKPKSGLLKTLGTMATGIIAPQLLAGTRFAKPYSLWRQYQTAKKYLPKGLTKTLAKKFDTQKKATKKLVSRDTRDGDGPKTIAEQVTQGAGLEEGQKMLGLDDKQIQQIYQGRNLLKQTIESGMYQDRRLNMNEMKMLQGHMMKLENLIQAIEKAQAPVNVAYGGRIDKALGGRSRDIG